jgi:hypothetical protein
MYSPGLKPGNTGLGLTPFFTLFINHGVLGIHARGSPAFFSKTESAILNSLFIGALGLPLL